ncbi:MAG TPA: hypothetical protein VMW24_00740 [Sedimentisphaerales bacterium]|nr:hypothetical protein [Sedimentisphaerales bacterium]
MAKAERIRPAVDGAMDEVKRTMNDVRALVRKLTVILETKIEPELDAALAQGYFEFIPRLPLIGEIPIKARFARPKNNE